MNHGKTWRRTYASQAYASESALAAGKRPAYRKEFLAGRRDRGADLESAVRVFLEFLRGYESLDFEAPCVTVFGSARFPESHRYYQLARTLGKSLAEAGFVVMTGGGPGIMEAANRGAKEGGGYTIGCNIVLPREQKPNPYLDRFVEFDHALVQCGFSETHQNAIAVDIMRRFAETEGFDWAGGLALGMWRRRLGTAAAREAGRPVADVLLALARAAAALAGGGRIRTR